MDNVVDFSTRRTSSRVSEVLCAIEAEVGKLFNDTFATTLAACDDALFVRAEKATNGNLQAHHFDDLRALRSNQANAVTRFRIACRAAFRHFRGDPAVTESVGDSDGEMQLVAHDDLELDLAMFRIGKRCDEAAPRLRHQVQRRFQVLLGLADETPSPLCGIGVARMCRAGITALDLGLEARLILLKRLELRFAEIAETALDHANNILVANGVLPNLRASVTRPPSTGGTRAASGTSQTHAVAVANDVRHAADAPPAADLNEVVAQVAQWLARQTPAEFAAVVGAPTLLAAPAAAEAPAAAAPAVDALLDSHTGELELARERRRAEIAERRAAEIERARVQRIAAERSTDSVIAAVVAQAHVPQSVREMIQGPLRRHLEIVYARRGEASTEWRSARKLVSDIAWSLDPETFRVERLHWNEVFPDIVQTLRSALAAAGLEDHNIARVVSEFSGRCEQLNATASAADIVNAAVDSAPQAAADAVPALALPQEPIDAPSFADALARVRRFMVGQWVEIVDDQGFAQRAKLVWTSAMTGRCLFVNGNGKLVADRPHARIAADVIAGNFRELNGLVSA